jgi:hypothetical protein
VAKIMETQFWIKLRFSECGLVEALVDMWRSGPPFGEVKT